MVFKTDLDEIAESIDRLLPRVLNIEKIKSWIKDCQNQHRNKCSRKSRYVIRELKMIDCIRERIVDAPSHCRYVALSYVWGKVQDTTFNTAPSFLYGLPRTILDAVQLTKDLGYRYLWVDRYVSRSYFFGICGRPHLFNSASPKTMLKLGTFRLHKWVTSMPQQT